MYYSNYTKATSYYLNFRLYDLHPPSPQKKKMLELKYFWYVSNSTDYKYYDIVRLVFIINGNRSLILMLEIIITNL